MSTKIYFAWRCPDVTLRPVLAQLRRFAVADASRRLAELAAAIAPRTAARAAAGIRKRFTGVPAARAAVVARVGLAVSVARDSSESPLRDGVLDVDASLNVWVHEDGYAYLIGYGECWGRFRQRLRYASDYSYWNNTDRPRRVTAEEWADRARTWDAVCLDDDWDAYRLVHTIVDVKAERGMRPVLLNLVQSNEVELALRDAEWFPPRKEKACPKKNKS